MEVFGIKSSNPSSVGDDSYKKSSPNPIGGNASILEVLKQSQQTQNEVLEILRSGSGSGMSLEKGQNTEQLELNTVAIYDLINALENLSADVNVSGIDADAFQTMASFGKNDKKMLGIEKFADVYEKVVKKIAGLDGYIKNIEGVTAAVTGAFGTVKELGKGILVFAGGLALLGFTLATFMSAITLGDMMVFAGIMSILWASSKLIGNSSWNFAKASLGIATLGLAVWAFTEVIDAKQGLDFMLSMGMISAGIAILSAATKGIGGGGTMNMIKGAGAIAAIAGSIWLLNKAISDFDEVDLILAGKMAIVAMGLGVAWYGMGMFATSIIKGAVSAVAIGASLWVLSRGIQEMGKIDLSLERGLELAAITVAAAGILTLIGNPVTIGFTLAGAAATAAIGGALWVLSAGLQSLTQVSVSEEQSLEFKNSLINTIDAISYLGNPLRIGMLALSVPAALALSGATLALSAAIWAVDKLPQLGDQKREEFSSTIGSLVDTYSGLGVWGLAKATAASGVVAIISGATLIAAGAIWAFTKISANPDAVDNAVLSLDNFISGVSGSFQKNSGSFDTIGRGVNRFMGLSSMVSEIADSVQRISNMEFLEKEIRNGKVVVTGVRKFTSDDFANVGSSIGEMLSALTDPLAQISSQKDTYSLGGFTITNPFSNKVQKGIEAMAGIGGIFTPLANVLDVFARNNIGTTKIKEFNSNIGLVLKGIGDAFSSGSMDIDEDIVEGMEGAAVVIGDLIGYVSNPKFGDGTKSFGGFSKNIASVKDSLNGMDLGKLSMMNDLVFNMNEMEKSGAIDDFVDAFKEFLDHLMKMDNRTSPTVRETIKNLPIINKEKSRDVAVQKNAIDSDMMQEIISNSNGDLVEIMDKLYSFLSSGDLKVQLKEGLV